MKNAIILHGSSGTPENHWLPSIRRFLEKNGYTVWSPQLPDTDRSELKVQLPFMLLHGKFDGETIMVGHSAGCPLILSVLEKIDVKIRKAILVAGFARPLRGESYPILQDNYDWQKIKSNVKEIIFINSDNDPWGCDDKEGRYMLDNLGGTQIIMQGEGHFGSDKFGQRYKEFPMLEKLLSSE